MNIIEPDFTKVTEHQKTQYELFFKTPIKEISEGGSLSHFTELAHKAIEVVLKANPAPKEKSDELTTLQASQWELDQISKIKERVAAAIIQKNNYYDTHLMGKIKKILLQLLCLWSKGYPRSIKTAEDFLFFWDSRCPLYHPSSDGTYFARFDWQFANIGNKLDLSKFYNYNSDRKINIIASPNSRFPSNFVVVKA